MNTSIIQLDSRKAKGSTVTHQQDTWLNKSKLLISVFIYHEEHPSSRPSIFTLFVLYLRDLKAVGHEGSKRALIERTFLWRRIKCANSR